MSVWELVLTVVGGWSLVSVVFGVVVGHAISGKSLRTRIATVESAMGSAVEAAIDAVAAPVAMLNDALSGEAAALDTAV